MNYTLDRAYQLFLLDRKTFCADRTCKYYEENIEKFLEYAKSKEVVYVNQIDTLLLSGYIMELRSRYRFEGHPVLEGVTTHRPLKNTSIRAYGRAVKAFVNFCKENCDLDIQVKFPKMPRDDSQQVVPLYQFEVDKIDELFNDHSEHGIRNYCIFHLMLDAGFRCREVVALRISDILFDKNCLVVNYSKSRSRVVLMASCLQYALRDYINCYRQNANINEPVFKSIRTDDYINNNVIKQLFARLKKKTGVERLHPHLLRHTFATSYIMGGGNLEMLRIMLGHYDYNVTKNYLHLASQYKMLQADIYKLDPVFFKTGY